MNVSNVLRIQIFRSSDALDVNRCTIAQSHVSAHTGVNATVWSVTILVNHLLPKLISRLPTKLISTLFCDISYRPALLVERNVPGDHTMIKPNKLVAACMRLEEEIYAFV